MMNEEFEEADKMAEKMTFEEQQRQFFEIFHTGKIEKYDDRFHNFKIAKKLIDDVFNAIIKDELIDSNDFEKMNKTTREVLRALYDFFIPVDEHKKGLVFDVNIWIYALEKYENQFKKLTQSNKGDQRSFWCIRIEAYIAALLPTAYLRAHTQGPGNIKIDKNNNIDMQTINRDGCKLADGTSYFSFRRSSKSIPGAHFFVGCYGGRSLLGGAAGISSFGRLATVFFKSYVKQTQLQGQTYATVFAPSEQRVSNLMK